jgi:hypothetical protein
MEEKNFHKIMEVFENGTELNLGMIRNTNIVKYGYNNIGKELTLCLQGSGEEQVVKRRLFCHWRW